MAEVLKNNSEILFLYDAKLTNPNGDPDDENKPRYDYDTQRNLVSDVRLKRYARDFWINKGKTVYVSKEEGKAQTATEKVADHLKDIQTRDEAVKKVVQTFVDVKYFGATIPIKDPLKKKIGLDSITLTGPVQFTWGYSLHPTEILHSSSITSQLAGRESDHGTIGKDWRIKYSLIGFYGIVSAWRASAVSLTSEDVDALDVDIIKGLKLMASTRSKIGQTPRLYLRIEWDNDETFYGDLRDLVNVQVKTSHVPADLEDLDIDLSELSRFVSDQKVKRIRLWVDDEFKSKVKGIELLKGDKVEEFSI